MKIDKILNFYPMHDFPRSIHFGVELVPSFWLLGSAQGRFSF